MTMCFLGQKKSKLSIKDKDGEGVLSNYIKNLRYLQEFDVKVQKDQCLL